MASKFNPESGKVKTTSQQKQTAAESAALASPVSAPEFDEAFNAVGKLQEFAQKHFWPLPAYFFDVTNPDTPATRQFSCTVRLLDSSARGAGTSKRLAKREAAACLLRRLLATTPNPSPGQTPKQPSLRASLELEEADFQRLRVSKRLQSAARAGAEVNGLFRGVRNRKAGVTLPVIDAPTLAAVNKRNAADQLLELGRTHRFGVQFLPQEESQRHRCVVKLSTMPTIVVVAGGNDAADSREQACRTALEYLSVLTQENAASALDTTPSGKK